MLRARLVPDGAVFVNEPRAHRRPLTWLFAPDKAPPSHAQLASHTDSLQCSHKGRAFIQHGQNRIPGLGRKHQHHPINARITVTL